MGTSSTDMQPLVRRLLSGDAARGEVPGGDLGPGARVCDRLRRPLTRLAGQAGFASLMSRALAVAKRRTTALEGLRVESDGLLSGARGPDAPSNNGAALDADAILVTELLGLLIIFIGAPLTFTLVREAWPEVRVETLVDRTEEQP